MIIEHCNCQSAYIIADLLVSHNVGNVVCSPGSRNAPLILAVAERNELSKHIVVDERSAAFIALGMTTTTLSPTALICTSGTALLNYAPAIAEAYYRKLPLIIISADRPKEWIDQDDSQTIRQPNALANFVKQSYDIPICNNDDTRALKYTNRIVNDALITATTGVPGPVHINVQYDLVTSCSNNRNLITLPQRKIEILEGEKKLSESLMNQIADDCRDKQIIIVAGFLPLDEDLNNSLKKISNCTNIFVAHEIISNLHIDNGGNYFEHALSYFQKEAKQLEPDIVMTIGGALVSKSTKEYLRQCNRTEHWNIGQQRTIVDPFMKLTRTIEVSPTIFFSKLANKLCSTKKPYNEQWSLLCHKGMATFTSKTDASIWTSDNAIGEIVNNMPKEWNLHLSNGTSIRIAQQYLKQLPHAVYCNRGVSGIEGSTSTAIGSSLLFDGTTLLITGDTSFSYDISALGSSLISEKIKIVVVNNSGGDIFRRVPFIRSLSCREQYFCTNPKTPIKKVAEAYKLKYFRADSANSLKETLPKFFDEKGSAALMEIVTPPTNVE
jgi:2-succinyl-5-enolpyruvyl-6-hydroxy-3-cyclohexene-1-carboxylate synthase